MTIAELFVELKVKGTEKATSALTSVEKGLVNISSGAFAAKAAVIGVIYALERLTIGAGQIGTNFAQFANYTGIGVEGLQRWQYAMMQSGVQASETQKNIENVQQTMGKLLLGEGQPKGYGLVQTAVGFDITRAKDALYVMGKLREYLKKDTNITRANEVGLSFGLTPAMIQALRTTTVEIDKIGRSELLSGSKIKILDRMNIGWMNFWRTLQLIQSNTVADSGFDKFMERLNVFSTKVLPVLVSSLASMANKLTIVFAPLQSFLKVILDTISEIKKYTQGKDSTFGAEGAVGKLGTEEGRKEYGDKARGFLHGLFGAPPSLTPQPAAPDTSGIPDGTKTSTMNIKIDNHGVQGANEIIDTFNTAVNFALRQMQSTTQVA